MRKVHEAAELRNYEYQVRRDKAKLRIEEAQRTSEEILEEKRRVFEEKEQMAKIRKEMKAHDDAVKLEERRAEQEKQVIECEERSDECTGMEIQRSRESSLTPFSSQMEHRRKLKADVDEQARLHAENIKKKEEEINKRLKARGLLPEPEDRMRRTDEEEKKKILASLESTKETEARRIRRMLKEEAIEKNMTRKLQADEYKRNKIMNKMEEDDKKLKEVKEGRAKIKLKKEIAAGQALQEKHRVAEMAKKALGNQALTGEKPRHVYNGAAIYQPFLTS